MPLDPGPDEIPASSPAAGGAPRPPKFRETSPRGQARRGPRFWGRCRRAGRDGPRRLGGWWRWPVNDVWLLHLAPSILSEIYRAHGAERKNARDGAACGGSVSAEAAGQVDVENIEVELAHLVQELGGLRVLSCLSGIPSRQARYSSCRQEGTLANPIRRVETVPGS